MAQQLKVSFKEDQIFLIKAQSNKMKWLASQNTTVSQHQSQDNQVDEQFKKQHKKYIAEKLKKKQEEIKKRKIQYGSSSSEQDIQHIQKNVLQKFTINVKPENTNSPPIDSVKENRMELHQQKIQKSDSPSKSLKIASSKQIQNVKKIQILVSSKKGSDVWVEDFIQLKQKIIVLPQFQCPLYDVNKLKLIYTDVSDRCFRMKLNWKNQQFYFAASYYKNEFQLPIVFYIFSKIINQKLLIMGKKIPHLSKVKQTGIPEILTKNSYIFGKLFKKSRVIGKWSEVFMIINKDGLYYYKKLSQKGNLLISRTAITEIWTRFEIENEMLVVKMFQNNSKIEIGIPIYDFVTSDGWLYYLFGLIFKSV